MTQFTVETTINASVEAVWAALADIGSISVWNPGIQASHLTSEQATGVGASRHCDLGGKNYLDEDVVQWQENERLTMRIVGTNMPFKTADIHFVLRPDSGSTVVELTPDYTIKFGPIGALLDRFYVRGTYEKGMHGLLRGLKKHVESA